MNGLLLKVMSAVRLRHHRIPCGRDQCHKRWRLIYRCRNGHSVCCMHNKSIPVFHVDNRAVLVLSSSLNNDYIFFAAHVICERQSQADSWQAHKGQIMHVSREPPQAVLEKRRQWRIKRASESLISYQLYKLSSYSRMGCFCQRWLVCLFVF